MRFFETDHESMCGEIKVVELFLWVPVTIGRETRWLEKAKIECVYGRTMFSECRNKWIYGWTELRFVDE